MPFTTSSICTGHSVLDSGYRRDLNYTNDELRRLVATDGEIHKYSETKDVGLWINNRPSA